MTRYSHMLFAPALAATALIAMANAPASAQGFTVVKQTAGSFKEVKLGEKREKHAPSRGGPVIFEDAEEAKPAAQAAAAPQSAQPGSAPADSPPGQPGASPQARQQPSRETPGEPGEAEPNAEN